MVVGFDIFGIVCLVPTSLVVFGEALVGLFPLVFFFFPLSHYFTNWQWFELDFALFQQCCIRLLRLFICLISMEEFVD